MIVFWLFHLVPYAFCAWPVSSLFFFFDQSLNIVSSQSHSSRPIFGELVFRVTHLSNLDGSHKYLQIILPWVVLQIDDIAFYIIIPLEELRWVIVLDCSRLKIVFSTFYFSHPNRYIENVNSCLVGWDGKLKLKLLISTVSNYCTWSHSLLKLSIMFYIVVIWIQ